MESVTSFIDAVASNYWNPYTISLLLGTGIILTIATKFIQFRKFGMGFKFTMLGAMHKDESSKDTGDITPFQALMTSLSSTVGNGNIAGVAMALCYGGPGAVFWMWVTAMVGMATKYSEAVLAVHYRKTAEDGSMSGGPMYYIRKGLVDFPVVGKLAVPLATVFAFFGAWTALFGTGNMMQANSIALVFSTEFNIAPYITGAIIFVLVGLVILGGIKRIGRTAEILVPGMIVLYFGCALYILIMNYSQIPAAFALIFKSAFQSQAVFGGAVGYSIMIAIQQGVRRGLLSNESGLGSTPIAHAASKARNPVRQGLIAMFDTFIDTIVVCTITALVIIVSGQYITNLGAAETFAISDAIRDAAGNVNEDMVSTALTAAAFNSTIPFGGKIVALSSALFGYSTLIGWYYYGERCFEYLFSLKKIKYYKIIYVCLTFVGSILQKENLTIVWNLGDLSNGLMAVPNLIGLVFLSGMVFKITKEYVDGNKI
ncbi:alanine/glycine:cation symporter family protein [candidate division KSB1 bacterium]